ncbi:MAG: hypothetical protein PWQ77_1380 [Kosmotogales bacterium]|nr:hypothetical protein [Kosmotogales bacterium]
MKIIIVGGVAGGASAAARLRRLDEYAQITVYEKTKNVSFANCGLPYYIGNVIKERENLLLETPETFKEKMNIEIKVEHEVTKIEPDKNKVYVKNLNTGGILEDNYDHLILSPGADPKIPEINGLEKDDSFALRNLKDMDRIIDFINEKNPKSATVVGAGYIGIELTENLKDRGLNVTLLEMQNQVLPHLDYEISAMIHDELIQNGINLILNDSIEKVEKVGSKKIITTKNNINITSDLILMCIGVSPMIDLARVAGIKTTKMGIVVNDYLQTNFSNIYAVGDVIENKNILSKEKCNIPLASPANRQGRLAADNIIKGNTEKYSGAMGTSIAKVFNLSVGSTGLNKKTLKRLNIDFLESTIIRGSNAGYYPGSFPLTIKLLFSKEGGIYGGQVIGYKGVDKRIDVLATSIRAGLKVSDLEELELAYAPPYGSAKDPVNISGYVSNNIIKNDMEVISWEEIDNLDKNSVLLDVRTKEEFSLGSIENAINIPLQELRENINKLDKSKKYIIFCQIGHRGYLAYRILKQYGFDSKNLSGGYKIYEYVHKSINGTKKPENIPVESKLENPDKSNTKENIIKIDARGLQCPGPIMKTYKEMEKINDGDILEVQATDPGFRNDIKKWAEKTGNTLISIETKNSTIYSRIKKGNNKKNAGNFSDPQKDGQTMVIFSNDFDKAIATFVIANGATAMGKKVSLFFTFWGLSILRKENFSSKNKNFIEKFFGFVLPNGINKLKMSKMNMFGIGPKVMKSLMRKKKIESLEKMMISAKENGIKFIACQMSMDLMGIKKEELIDGIEIGGVATYLSQAEDSNLNLFI